jgi:glycosyltransferase involved in cell wall biosynthesis
MYHQTTPLESLPQTGATVPRRRIVINGRFAGRAVTGVERYAGEMVRALDELARQNHPLTTGLEFVLVTPRNVEVRLPLTHVGVAQTGRFSGYLWEQFSLPSFANGDLILNLCSLAPVLRARTITCVHDAHVWLIPQNYSRAFLAAYSALLPLVIRRSRRWMTVSQFSARELTRLSVADRPPELITPNGADHALRWDAGKAALRRADLPARYVLALGSRSYNKNLGLIYSLAESIEPLGIAVVVAGGRNGRIFGSGDTAAARNVYELGRISDDDLALLFENALTFLFPSLFEGFGLPPVEAMLHACPVIASNSSAMPEVLGDAAILCDPCAQDQWVAAIGRLASDAALRAEMIRRGRDRAGRYRWRNSAVALLEQIREVEQSDQAQPRRILSALSTCWR